MGDKSRSVIIVDFTNTHTTRQTVATVQYSYSLYNTSYTSITLIGVSSLVTKWQIQLVFNFCLHENQTNNKSVLLNLNGEFYVTICQNNYSINDNRTLYTTQWSTRYTIHFYTLHIYKCVFTSMNMICLHVQSSLFNPIVKSIENKK